ncbi:unnamed protein product [Protopolystoma xenopodis]|uniref:Uncharacterized protein n=1 Tax=Protopolystoma xenopodis TaxID=117903 RepID=A0A3S5A519_9PLAT|nr:unnamed protein product [Protopolystoma xenopodis]
MTTSDKCSSDGGLVRVINMIQGHKVLLKSFYGFIVSLGFSKCPQICLAILDSTGDTLEYKVLLRVSPHVLNLVDTHVLNWCEFDSSSRDLDWNTEEQTTGRHRRIPDNPFHLIAISCGTEVEVFHFSSLVVRLGVPFPSVQNDSSGLPGWDRDSIKKHLASDNSNCDIVYLHGKDHTGPITSVSICPNASFLATIGLDGLLLIYSLRCINYDNEIKLKPLLTWSPHSGSPLYSLFFITDEEDQYS